jgi:NRAMP (natural resistance-associated macrophage protein)-like metal ion transporter
MTKIRRHSYYSKAKENKAVKLKPSILQKVLKVIGPGFITGASDDDPSGIATYAQTGAQFGYQQLWTVFFTTPLMTAVQEMCGRIGIVTCKGLTQVMKENYPKGIAYFCVFLLLIANTINIGANLGAMAASLEMLIHLPAVLLIVVLAGVSITLEIFLPYKRYSQVLKFLTIGLLAYVLTAFFVKQDWGVILRSSVLPQLTWNREYFFNLIAILGTTISPYLFFWQIDEESEELRLAQKATWEQTARRQPEQSELRQMRLGTTVGMVFSNAIMFFIILTTASTLHIQGIKNITTASEAAKALQPIAGNAASFLFAIGVVGVGLLAVPVLSGSAAYAVAQLFNWKYGLNRKFSQAKQFYLVMALGVLAGVGLNFVGLPAFTALYLSAVINGLVAPILIVMLLLITNNSHIMGKHTNSWISNLLGVITVGVMTLAGVALLVTTLLP